MLHQYQQRLDIKTLCQWVQLQLSSFHYKLLERKPGAKPSVYTKMQNGTKEHKKSPHYGEPI